MIVDRTEITNGKLKRQQVFSLPVIYTIHDDRNFAEKPGENLSKKLID